MKYRVMRCTDSPKKRKSKGCSTWSYIILDDFESAKETATKWKQEGFYVKIDKIENKFTYNTNEYCWQTGDYSDSCDCELCSHKQECSGYDKDDD